MRTIVTFEGRLAADPKLTITPNGKNIVECSVAVNERRQVDGEWVDGDTTWHDVKAFRQMAENIVDSLRKGDLIFVHGTMTTDTWIDKETEQNRYARKILADIVGPSLRYDTAKPTRTPRAEPQPADDPTDRHPAAV